MVLKAGQSLKQFRVESLLGRGGMGIVYRAVDTRLERPVAVKVLKPEAMGSEDRSRRFVQEARGPRRTAREVLGKDGGPRRVRRPGEVVGVARAPVLQHVEQGCEVPRLPRRVLEVHGQGRVGRRDVARKAPHDRTRTERRPGGPRHLHPPGRRQRASAAPGPDRQA